MGGRIADKIPWCKFWTSCLTDPDLEDLELHQWARWARLIIFLRAHGEAGKMKLIAPALSLQRTMRVPSYGELLEVIKLFHNVTLTPLSHTPIGVTANDTSQQPSHETLQSYFVSCKNWWKYQQDSSKERTRKWRHKKSVTKSVTKDAVDKSRVDLTSTSTSYPASRVGAFADASRLPLAGNGGKPEHMKTSADLPVEEQMTKEDWAELKAKLVREKLKHEKV